jgi:hypothetical protein
MARKLTPPNQIKAGPYWIGISWCDQRVRRPDEPPPASKWIAFREWVSGYRALHIQDWLERRLPWLGWPEE